MDTDQKISTVFCSLLAESGHRQQAWEGLPYNAFLRSIFSSSGLLKTKYIDYGAQSYVIIYGLLLLMAIRKAMDQPGASNYKSIGKLHNTILLQVLCYLINLDYNTYRPS